MLEEIFHRTKIFNVKIPKRNALLEKFQNVKYLVQNILLFFFCITSYNVPLRKTGNTSHLRWKFVFMGTGVKGEKYIIVLKIVFYWE